MKKDLFVLSEINLQNKNKKECLFFRFEENSNHVSAQDKINVRWSLDNFSFNQKESQNFWRQIAFWGTASTIM